MTDYATKNKSNIQSGRVRIGSRDKRVSDSRNGEAGGSV